MVSQWPLSTFPFSGVPFSHLMVTTAAYQPVLSSFFCFWAFVWEASQKYAILVPAGVTIPLKYCSIG